MSAVEAAGYVMAPDADDFEDASLRQLDVALRNGHAAAAQRVSRALVSRQGPLRYRDLGRLHWFRDHMTGWWGGRAPA